MNAAREVVGGLPAFDAVAGWFAADRVRVGALLAGPGATRARARPASGSWSALECVEHLVVTGTRMLPGLDRGLDAAPPLAAPATGAVPWGGWFERWFVGVMGAAPGGRPRSKMPTARPFIPRADLDPAAVQAAFERLQDDLVARVGCARERDVWKVKVPSSVQPLIRVRLGAWFTALALHQDRHLWQAARALEAAS